MISIWDMSSFEGFPYQEAVKLLGVFDAEDLVSGEDDHVDETLEKRHDSDRAVESAERMQRKPEQVGRKAKAIGEEQRNQMQHRKSTRTTAGLRQGRHPHKVTCCGSRPVHRHTKHVPACKGRGKTSALDQSGVDQIFEDEEQRAILHPLRNK